MTTGTNGSKDTLRLDLTINTGSLSLVTDTACDSYTWTTGDGNTYTVSGIYDYITTGTNGCNDTLRLDLTINTGTLTLVTETACDSYTWTSGDGNTYTVSGIYDYITIGTNGCNDTLRLDLTINTCTMIIVTETDWDSF